jgi:hypothetical protein
MFKWDIIYKKRLKVEGYIMKKISRILIINIAYK